MNVDFELYELFAEMYLKNNLRYLLESSVPKLVLIDVYKILVKDNLLKPIEQLPDGKKQELVNECRATGLLFTNESLIRSARILHTLKLVG